MEASSSSSLGVSLQVGGAAAHINVSKTGFIFNVTKTGSIIVGVVALAVTVIKNRERILQNDFFHHREVRADSTLVMLAAAVSLLSAVYITDLVAGRAYITKKLPLLGYALLGITLLGAAGIAALNVYRRYKDNDDQAGTEDNPYKTQGK
ncbi:MAG: hypothetical protein SP4CHLAM5_08380 [Chlamydiia bacterium]|nr:hypothetical protein [Chlamydiia bacterium]MCH9618701.1 hypothetical protein [Chlamydiia bacterium]MCH9624381.1 hypothetical protein [Chlamydiia bacterium]